jgi:hypothetical protein
VPARESQCRQSPRPCARIERKTAATTNTNDGNKSHRTFRALRSPALLSIAPP